MPDLRQSVSQKKVLLNRLVPVVYSVVLSIKRIKALWYERHFFRRCSLMPETMYS